ncbi:hypothetical protein DRP77_09240 [Candidatus Poribacteria bacterium]|nr:MAG: hypothetical protein DRP77_09240 [Candidatus Poribacteria bacterium]
MRGTLKLLPILILFPSLASLGSVLYQIHLPIEGCEHLVTLTNPGFDPLEARISISSGGSRKTLVKVVQPGTTLRVCIDGLADGPSLIRVEGPEALRAVYWGIRWGEPVFGAPFMRGGGRSFVLGNIPTPGSRSYLLIADVPDGRGLGSLVGVRAFNRRGEVVLSERETLGEGEVRVLDLSGFGIGQAEVEILEGEAVCAYRRVDRGGAVLSINGFPSPSGGEKLFLIPPPLRGDGRLFLANCSEGKAGAVIRLRGEGGERSIRKLLPPKGAILLKLSDILPLPVEVRVESRSPLASWYMPSPTIAIEPLEGEAPLLAAALPTPISAELILFNPSEEERVISFGGRGKEPETRVSLRPRSWIAREISTTSFIRSSGGVEGLILGLKEGRPVWAVQIKR